MKLRIQSVVTFAALAGAALGVLPAASAAEIRLNGATTTIQGVVNPRKDAVEKATGHTLTIVGNNTGRGLADLADGKCDAALTSEPLDIALSAAKAAGKDLNAADYQLHTLSESQIAFVVNPANPVSKLTLAQVKDIHLGKIANWKEVGGADMPIVVFTDALTGGTRAMVKKAVLGGEEYGPKCRPLDSVRLVNSSVSELRVGCGMVGIGFVTSAVKVVETEKVVRPLGIITKGAPTADVQKVIEAFKAAGK